MAARSKAAGLAILLVWAALSSAARAGSLEDAQRDRDVAFGGAAHVTAFVGHNGLMDFDAPVLTRSGLKPRVHASVVLACMSQQYFSPVLKAHLVPLLLTTGLMAPEAYTLDAVLTSWFSGESSAEVRLAAARAYARHQRSPERAALRLFATPH